MKVSIIPRFFVSSIVHVLAVSGALARHAHRSLVWWVAVTLVAATVLATGCGSVSEQPDARISDDASRSDGQPCTRACLSETSLRECTGGERTVACPLGCVTEEARCRTLVPSNGVFTEHLVDVTGVLSIPMDAQVLVDTDVGSITVAEQSLRGPGVGVNQGIGFQYTDDGLSVLAVQGMSMGARSYLRATGERPLLILSAGDVEIAGTIDVSAGCDTGTPAQICGGPGGGRGGDAQNLATGCGSGGNGSGAQGIPEGGGGGGFGQDGAAGGGAANAGQACEASLVPLRGGSGGGRSLSTNGEGVGGGGGGAVQITSYTAIRLVSPAVIDAGGSGGAGGSASGGGGGSGGGILLEAPVLSIDGAILAANGGGGGGNPGEGEDGFPDIQQARGEGGGGLGGALTGAPTAGVLISNYGYSFTVGGGGGGVGLIHIRAPLTSYSATNTRTSPAPVRLDPEAN